ncbi:MAG: ribonuclease P protein component [Rhodospirillales bacterium]|nr:ribonuclease P protein component [Rhodospirillales bacterium]
MAKSQTPPARLTRRAEFLRLASGGKKIARHGFVLQAAKDGQAEVLRVGYTATKKIGNAVIRNRAKRRLREAARLLLAGRSLPGVELVLIARRETGEMEFSRLTQNLNKALDEVLA